MIVVDKDDSLLILANDLDQSVFLEARAQGFVINRASVLNMMDLSPTDTGEVSRRVKFIEDLFFDDANIVVCRKLKLTRVVKLIAT